MTARIAFIGCVAFSQAALSHLLTLGTARVVGIVTRAASRFNADFVSLTSLAERAGCPVHLAESGDDAAMAAFLNSVKPDAIYCFGWSSLLGTDILTLAPQGVIGFHPAALPANRGRHPLIWALALGLTETASTFFVMDEGADSGDIVSQRPLAITPEDDAASLYDRMTKVALEQITDFTAALATGSLPRRPQNHASANLWRKRGACDGLIDWRMTADAIRNLVRALTRPYVGAHVLMPDGREAKVWRVEAGPSAPANLEPGKVLAVEGRTILVKCWGGTIRLVEHDLDPIPEPGNYL